MGLIQAFKGALSGTFADQWKEIVTAGAFEALTVVSPGVLKQFNHGRGTNYKGSSGVISNGSKIYVPENTAAFIFNQAGIETIVTQPGGYVLRTGEASVFAGDGILDSFVDQIGERFGFGGQPSELRHIAFVNLRELRGIKFGTRGPVVYHDSFYGTDLEVTAFGHYSIRVTDVVKFVRNYLPPNVTHYSFARRESRQQLAAEFIQSFTASLNSLSSEYRISQLPSQAYAITAKVMDGNGNASTWPERFGIEIVNIGIENIEFTEDAKQLVNMFSSNLMSLKAYENISKHSSDVSAQQKIAQGIENHGLGDGAGMIFGMNLAQSLNPQTGESHQAVTATPQPEPTPPKVSPKTNPASSPIAPPPPPVTLTLDEQIEAVKKLKELLDAGILTDEEFEFKKRQVMGFTSN